MTPHSGRHRAGLLPALCLAMLVGCGSTPIAVPPVAAANRSAVQVDGATGPLSAQRSKEILDRLKAGGKETSIFERHLALEQAVAGSPLVAGNKVSLLQDGPRTYQAMADAIEAARDHINMESYILEDDEVGQRFAAALIAKRRQGVQVNLIHDSVGTLRTSADFFQRLRDNGINVLEFNPVNPLAARAAWDVNQRDHRKMLVVDGRRAILGGINVSSVYSGGSLREGAQDGPAAGLPWRDTDLDVEGPVVAEFQKLFIETWRRQHGPELGQSNYFPPLARTGDAVMRAIGSSPDAPYSLIYATLLSAINSAETEICLTNAYFTPDPQLRAALKSAAARGVDVRLVLPSRTDSRLVLYAGHSYYDELLEAGVKIYERREALLHAKTGVIDGVWSTVGSANLDWRSFVHNQELNAVVLGAEFGAQMHAAFERDLAASTQITLDQWRQRPLHRRVREWLSRMWSYWL